MPEENVKIGKENIEKSEAKSEGDSAMRDDNLERESGVGEKARREVEEEIERSEGAASAGGGLAGIVKSDRQKQKEREKRIEKTLEENLEELYVSMPPDKQKIFREEGERTAREINSVLGMAKVHVKKIINLIKKWLSIIPGVNKFFLEQEAKIKADEIIKLKKEEE